MIFKTWPWYGTRRLTRTGSGSGSYMLQDRATGVGMSSTPVTYLLTESGNFITTEGGSLLLWDI